MPSSEPTTRLMLILPADIAAPAVEALVRAGDIAAVVARVADGPKERERLAALATPIQQTGAAFLLDGRADLVAAVGADGAHLPGVSPLRAALPALKPRHIAGVGGLASRHHAMEAGEAGADYVLFGDLEGPFEHTLDAVDWWAELFEVPCVGIARTEEEALALARAGADFVALDGPMLTEAAIGKVDALIRVAETQR